MTLDPPVLPGLFFLAAELLVLTAFGYVAARVALRQTDGRLALAQGLVIGPALWGLIVNFVLYLLPGLAGAVAGWVVMLACGAVLAWRAPSALRLPLRTVVGFVLAALAVFWVALAARQTLSIPDAATHLGLAASIRAGSFPPTFPWIPDEPVPYHYGVDMLIGLLAPPVGPDLAFVTELFSAYVWTSFVLVVATTLLRRSSLSIALILTPLLLTAGAWTLVSTAAPSIVQIPIPTGTPAAGLRASLTSIYWPEVSLPWMARVDAVPPNVWKPLFVFAYALSVVALEGIATRREHSWPSAMTLAAVVGFLGLVDEAVALVMLGLWTLLEICFVVRTRPRPWTGLEDIGRVAAGPALAGLLLVSSSEAIGNIIFGSTGSGLTLGWLEDAGSRLPFGELSELQGGIGLLRVGPLLLAVAAFALARHQQMVLAFVVGCATFVVAALTLQYAPVPDDVTRFDGYARNFALLAFVIALSARLTALRLSWRYGAIALLLALLIWPTTIGPVRGLALALRHGVRVENTQPHRGELDSSLKGRYGLGQLGTTYVATYVREHTPVDARILSPDPVNLSINTGRPTGFGFAGHVNLRPVSGPDYQDAIRFLEPTAVRRLGYSYVHATDAWIAGLPDRAQQWLANPHLFAPIVRDGAHALYGIHPAFLQLQPPPAPESFEALRRAVPSAATVVLTESQQRIENVRIATSLSHARLYGEIDPTAIHLLSDIPIEPVRNARPDVVVIARDRAVYANTRALQPIWWNHSAIAYALSADIPTRIDAPPPPNRDFSVQITDVRPSARRISFSVTFTDHAPTRWTGQDWLVIPVDSTPWALPTRFAPDGFTLVGSRWFAGQIAPGPGPVTYHYQFDARTHHLALQAADGTLASLPASGDRLPPGTYTLAVRLRHNHLQAATIPVLHLTVAANDTATFSVYPSQPAVAVNPCPVRLQNTDSCRRLSVDLRPIGDPPPKP